MSATHETVGHYFLSGGATYLCTRWERSCGFWMRLVQGEDKLCDRKVGDEACVSERAIGRTYHRDYNRDDVMIAHETLCNCYVCEGRPG